MKMDEQSIDKFMDNNKELFEDLAKLEEQEKIAQIENASKPEDVLDTRSPVEIEQELLAKEELAQLEALSKIPPEEFATTFFKGLRDRYIDMVHGLSAKRAKQVLEALVLYPLENDGIKFDSKHAEATFSLGSKLIDAKFIIIQASQMDKALEEDRKANETQEILNNVETNFKQGEEVNG